MTLRSLDNESLLLQQLHEGHEPAFRALYEGYSAGIYSIALQHLKLPHLAEDIVQSVFLKLWENRGEVKHVQQFAAWFYTLARNTIISTLRKQGSHEAYKKYLKERMETAQAGPEPEVLIKEQMALIRRAVEQLSPQQRTAFQLQREEGLSYEDIGQRMGIATNTVRVHLYKAMESLRAFVQSHGADDIAVAYFVSLILLD